MSEPLSREQLEAIEPNASVPAKRVKEIRDTALSYLDRAEAAERERDLARQEAADAWKHLNGRADASLEASADAIRLAAAEPALGACREALEEVMEFVRSEHQRGGSEAMYYGAAFEPRVEKLRMWDVLADTAAAGAQRDERLRAETIKQVAEFLHDNQHTIADFAKNKWSAVALCEYLARALPVEPGR